MADKLPARLYDVASVRALDAAAMSVPGNDGLTLMKRAGASVYRTLRQRWPVCRRLTVVCGPGNNAGDGYVVARLAAIDRINVDVVQLGDPPSGDGDAALCYAELSDTDVPILATLPSLNEGDVIVDALFGIGLTRAVTGAAADLIEQINNSPARVISIDVPSGLQADTGFCPGVSVRADATVTFIGLKRGLFTGVAPELTGDIIFDDLSVPETVYQGQRHFATRIEVADVSFAPRSKSAHKGHHGHVLLIGGAPGYSGAIRLAARAALRAGAGLVSVATHPQSVGNVAIEGAEIMVHGISDTAELRALQERADIIAIGPGLGQSTWSTQCFDNALEQPKPLVVDADALNLLAQEPTQRSNWILTPHPGEAARLLNATTMRIAEDRFRAVRELATRYGGTVVLKGAGSLICHNDDVFLATDGNPGMGSGGMGDVLTGVIAALAAQRLRLDVAARYGVCVHAGAADKAALNGERGLLASDLMPHIRKLVNH